MEKINEFSMSYLKERLKHAIRFRHKRGYGVHSPFMFNLILNVIRDKEKRFSYPDGLGKNRELRNREKKVFRLLSRLIRHLKTEQICCLGIHAPLLVEYLRQTYPTAIITCNDLEQLEKIDFLYIGRKAEEYVQLGTLETLLDRKKIKYIIVSDIYKTSLHSRLWRMYRNQATAIVDMMWYGLLVYDEKVQRGKYNLII